MPPRRTGKLGERKENRTDGAAGESRPGGIQELERRIREITLAHDKLERDLRTNEEKLASRERELSQFAYAVSHDLQEPLRSMTGYLELIRQKMGDSPHPDLARYVGRASEAGDRMVGYIHDLLAYSRIGAVDCGFAPVDMSDILTQALAGLEGLSTETSAAITRDPLPKVRGIGFLLVQLFQNLIGNALKYRSAATPRVHVSAHRAPEGWAFSVRDNGIGIAPRFHDRIFRIFQRLHTYREYPGTGAGLAIVRKIAEIHGGSVRVESEPGNGSTFIFLLPDSAEDRPDTQDPTVENTPPPFDSASRPGQERSPA